MPSLPFGMVGALESLAMRRKSNRNGTQPLELFIDIEVEEARDCAADESGVRVLPRASLPPIHPSLKRTLKAASTPQTRNAPPPLPASVPQTRKAPPPLSPSVQRQKTPPPLPTKALVATTARGHHGTERGGSAAVLPLRRLDVTPPVPTAAPERLLLERAQRKARIREAAAQASLRLQEQFREDEERFREEMAWCAAMRAAKKRLEEEAAARIALAAQQARAEAEREHAEWLAALEAARQRAA